MHFHFFEGGGGGVGGGLDGWGRSNLLDRPVNLGLFSLVPRSV